MTVSRAHYQSWVDFLEAERALVEPTDVDQRIHLTELIAQEKRLMERRSK